MYESDPMSFESTNYRERMGVNTMPDMYLQIKNSEGLYETLNTAVHDGTDNSMIEAHQSLDRLKRDWMFNEPAFVSSQFRILTDVQLRNEDEQRNIKLAVQARPASAGA